MIRRVTFALLLATCPALAGDGDAATPPAPPPAQPAPPAEPLQPTRGVRYKVTLKGGRSVSGIVTCAGVFERRDGVSWVASEKDAPGAGIRVHYMRGQEGFVFIPCKSIRTVEATTELSEDEGREISEQRAAMGRRAEDERGQIKRDRAARAEAAAAAAKGAAKGTAEPSPEASDKGGAPSADSVEESAVDRIARFVALLQKYPPGEWTPESPKEIEHRRVVMDLLPSEKEKAFVLTFPEWLEAYTMWKSGQETEKAPAPEAAKK